MKEIFAAFAAEIFRPILTLLIPGFWALSPATIAVLLNVRPSWDFCKIHVTASSLVFITIAIAVGMLLENFGGELENHFFSKHGSEALSDWYRYLGLALDPQPIALSYIRSYVLRLKFEGGLFSGSPLAVLGVLFLPTGWLYKGGLILAILLVAIYMFFQVRSSVEELVNVRRHLLLTLAAHPADIKEAK